jgi:hypothetical protein
MNALSRGIDECAEPRAWIDAQVTKLNGKHSQDNGPAHNPASFAMKTTSIPRSSRRRPPEALPSTRKPRDGTAARPCSRRKFPPIPAQPGSAMTGLSRRRSRVRASSLPFLLSLQTDPFSHFSKLPRSLDRAEGVPGPSPGVGFRPLCRSFLLQWQRRRTFLGYETGTFSDLFTVSEGVPPPGRFILISR